MRPAFVFLGDEDRAMSHLSEAEALAAAGIRAMQLGDGTIVDVVGDVVYIDSPFLSEYNMVVPRDVEGGGYILDIYGYTHRKDAMIPKGRFTSGPAYAGFPLLLGPEVYYMTDGVAMKTGVSSPSSIGSLRSPMDFMVQMSLTSPIEDIIPDQGIKTAQGFDATSVYYPAKVSVNAQGDNFYTVCPYGVDRGGTYPVYRGTIGMLYQSDATITRQYYDSGNKSVYYSSVISTMLYTEGGKGYTAAQNGFGLAYDIMVHNDDGNITSAPFPIVIPLGNNRVCILGRNINANSAYIYGGTFALYGFIVSGTSYTFNGFSTAGITNTYFNGASWNYGLVSGSNLLIPSDAWRSLFLFETLAESQRTCVPLSQDETILFGYRWGIGAYWGKTDTTYNAQIVCFSVTPSGITQKGVVFSYWDDFMATNKGNANFSGTTSIRYTMALLGSCSVGGSKILAYYRRNKSDGGSTTFYFDGIYRFISTDGGATWDSGTQCVLNLDDPDAPYYIVFSPPQWLQTPSGLDPIIITGYLRGENAGGGNITLKNACILQSTDGGITFNLGVSGTADQVYTMPTGGWVGTMLYQTQKGAGSLQMFGNHEDGYAPSPYRNLPTYYGTPTKACRDSSSDPGL